MKRRSKEEIAEAREAVRKFLDDQFGLITCCTCKSEHRFHDVREWRFDFAWPRLKVAIELEGGRAHTRTGRFIKDMEKYNTAQSMGWQVYRFTNAQITNGYLVNFIMSEVFK